MSTINVAYQAVILKRCLGEKGLLELHEDYRAACHKVRRDKPATKQAREMLKLYRKGLLVSEIARKYGVSFHKAQYAIERAALEASRKSV